MDTHKVTQAVLVQTILRRGVGTEVMAKAGRKPKYKKVLKGLIPHKLYTAASIVRAFNDPNAMRRYISQLGHPSATQEENEKRVLHKIRVSLNRLAAYHHFPPEGDGPVFEKGQQVRPGWYGARWQNPGKSWRI